MALPRIFDAHQLFQIDNDKEWAETYGQTQKALLLDFAFRLFRESDRGCLLLAQSTMDVKLKELLGLVFDSQVDPDNPLTSEDRKNLFSSVTAPLQSFSNCVKICRALGAISMYEAKLLVKFNKLRIPGAHSADDVKLLEEDLTPLISHLGFGWIARIGFLVGFPKAAYELTRDRSGEEAAKALLKEWGAPENLFDDDPRMSFAIAASIMLFLLNFRIDILKRKMSNSADSTESPDTAPVASQEETCSAQDIPDRK